MLSMPRAAVVAAVILAVALSGGCKKNGKKSWTDFWGKKKSGEVSEGTIPPPPPVEEGSGMGGGIPLEIPPLSPATTFEQLSASGLQLSNPQRTTPSGAPSGLQPVLFEFDSYQLSDAARTTLDLNAEWLAQRPTLIVQVEGHCDERGTTEYNIALGERRAATVREYLATKGVNPNNLTVISYGEERPVATGHNEEAYGKNRRVQFMAYE